MHHWMDPRLTRVYDHPAASPPPPRPRADNDIGARVARIEEHQNFQAANAMRIEMNGLSRARDMGEAIHGLHQRLTTIEQERQQERRSRRERDRMLRRLLESGSAFAKYVSVAILAALLMSGKMPIEAVQVFLRALGFPAG